MTEAPTKTDALREYVKVNWPEVTDLDTCMEYLLFHEKQFYIDDIVAFYLQTHEQ
jgi:hypothetical protein